MGTVVPEVTRATFGGFELIERLGAGGMAEAWLACMPGPDGFKKRVVLKRILPRHTKNRTFIKMLISEAKMSSVLQHTNVVQVFELGQVDDEYYIAMEYVDGWNLLEVLRMVTTRRRWFPLPAAIHICAQLCRGLAHAHSVVNEEGEALGLVHMDVSPSNILLSHHGEVKLSDFGVARAASRQSTVSETPLRGKLAYMTPEQVAGEEVDHRADLFAVGIILYELCTLKRLFRADTPLKTLVNVRDAPIEPRLSHHTEIPRTIQAILRKALAKNPKHRYQSAQELEDALQNYLFDTKQEIQPHNIGTWLSELMSGEGSDGTHPNAINTWEQGSSTSGASWAAELDTSQPMTEAARRVLRRLRRSTFVFKTQNGTQFGPVTCREALELARQDAISPNEQVSVDGGHFKPVHTIAPLTSALASTAQAKTNLRKASPTVDIHPGHTLRWLAQLATRRETGCLRFSSEGVHKNVYWRRGRIVQVTSNDKSELLGPLLLENGWVNEVQLKTALSGLGCETPQLGMALVKLGYLDQRQLHGLLVEQLTTRFQKLISWSQGEAVFLQDESNSNESVPLDIDPLAALPGAVQKYLDNQHLWAHFTQYSGDGFVCVKSPPFDPSLFRLGTKEYRALAVLAQGPFSLEETLRQLHDILHDRRHVLRIVYLLHHTGHVTTA